MSGVRLRVMGIRMICVRVVSRLGVEEVDDGL